MTERKYFLVRVERTLGGSLYVTSRDVAAHVGAHPELINRFVDLGLIDPVGRDQNNEFLFPVEVIPLIKKILRLRSQLGVNYIGIGVILELMDRIESLESQIRELESKLFS